MTVLQTISLDTSLRSLANETQIIEDNHLGIEYLGWAPFRSMEEGLPEYGASHLRWPGGIPAEEILNPNTPDRLGDFGAISFQELSEGSYAYDMKNPNYVTDDPQWKRGDGSDREGLKEIFAFAEENNVSSLAIVVGISKYAADLIRINRDGEVEFRHEDIQAQVLQKKVVKDVTEFLENIFSSEGPNPPEKLTLEIGSEYYATNLWWYFVRPELKDFAEEYTGDQEQAAQILLEANGLVTAAMVSAVAAFEAKHGIEVEVAVQAGKYTDGVNATQNANDIFIDSFDHPLITNLKLDVDVNGIEGVDAVIWHRYTSGFDSLGKEISYDGNDPNSVPDLPAAVEAWSAASNNDVDLIGGWLSPTNSAANVDSRLHLNQMLQLFSELTAAGMDASTVFATHETDGGGLGNSSQLWLSGQLYSLMVDNLSGTKIHDNFRANEALVEIGDFDNDPQTPVTLAVPIDETEKVNEFVFSNEYKQVIYLTVGNISDEGVQAKLEFDRDVAYVQETRLFATSEEVEEVTSSYRLWREWKENGSVGEEPDKLIGVAGSRETTEYTGQTISNISISFNYDYEIVEYVAISERVTTSDDYSLEDVEERYQDIVTDLKFLGSSNLVGEGNGFDNWILGNAGDNLIKGLSGNDVLFDGRGEDTLVGGNGNDSFVLSKDGQEDHVSDFDPDEDVLILGTWDGLESVEQLSITPTANGVTIRFQDEVILVTSRNGDTISESEISNSIRFVEVSFEDSVLDHLVPKGDAQDNRIVGNEWDNNLNGAGGDDTLIGGAGNDTFKDDEGDDRMVGGTGNDIYHVDSLQDQIIELEKEGNDQVISSISYSLRSQSQRVENLKLTGIDDLDATGNGKSNEIVGNSGDNRLNGAWGNDTLIGGDGHDTFKDDAGDDRMIGGAGNDTYHVDSRQDEIIELENEGNDKVISSVSFSLRSQSQYIEDLKLSGIKDLYATGNSQDNEIIGNSGNNRLNGAWGDDTLIGGDGNDTFTDDDGNDRMIGGAGNDVYHVDSRQDEIIELENEGNDQVISSVSYSLKSQSQYIEDLKLSGTDNLHARGNSKDNEIVGNSGNNRLNGAMGNDSLIGGDGNDTFVFRRKFGKDEIVDFSVEQEADIIDLRGVDEISNFSDLKSNHMKQIGQDTIIEVGNLGSIVLTDVDMDTLSPSHFIL